MSSGSVPVELSYHQRVAQKVARRYRQADSGTALSHPKLKQFLREFDSRKYGYMAHFNTQKPGARPKNTGKAGRMSARELEENLQFESNEDFSADLFAKIERDIVAKIPDHASPADRESLGEPGSDVFTDRDAASRRDQ